MPLRRAILPVLKQDAAVTELVGAERIYPPTMPPNPSWPFIRYETGSTAAIGKIAASVSASIHAFAKPRMEGVAIVETAEDHAYRIGGAIVSALDRRSVILSYEGVRAALRCSLLVLRDGDEADAYHAVVQIRARAIIGC